jgi:hypothetical protein
VQKKENVFNLECAFRQPGVFDLRIEFCGNLLLKGFFLLLRLNGEISYILEGEKVLGEILPHFDWRGESAFQESTSTSCSFRFSFCSLFFIFITVYN